MSNVLVELSNAMAAAAEKAGASTVLVNARRRMPASGIAFAADLVLTADHVIEQEDGITVMLPDGTEVGRQAGRARPRLGPGRPAAGKGAAQTGRTRQAARIGELVLALGRPPRKGSKPAWAWSAPWAGRYARRTAARHATSAPTPPPTRVSPAGRWWMRKAGWSG